jgi:hypothetical protein
MGFSEQEILYGDPIDLFLPVWFLGSFFNEPSDE